MRPRAILFDYGGTLDGPASHWLPRFLQLYHAAGVELTFERFRLAFDHATRCGYRDPRVATFDLQELVEFHVARQLEHLGLTTAGVATQVVRAFVRGSRTALADSRAVLGRLHGRVVLGVVSNFYGNVERILDDAGFAVLLDAIVDSGCVGVSKPNPAIFALALQQLDCEPAETLYVGDSFEKDVVGARGAGLRTAWVVGAAEPPCRAPELVDVRLHTLADVEALVA
jgi:HAD superfamily hydrolase (TIGR01509 family)